MYSAFGLQREACSVQLYLFSAFGFWLSALGFSLGHFYGLQALLDLYCGIAGHNGVGGHALGNYRTTTNGHLVANCYIADDTGIAPHIYMITEHRRARHGAVRQLFIADSSAVAQGTVIADHHPVIQYQSLAMVDPEPTANLCIPWDLDTKDPFNEDLVKDAIGKPEVIKYLMGSAKVGQAEQQHDHTSFRTGFIGFPVLQYE
jgi:hypothetical protein